MYQDYSINESLFHWQSQSTTSDSSPTGQRYQNHRRQGGKVLLFVRESKQELGVSAMVLSINSYARNQSRKIHEIIDYLLDRQYPDGGWNCRWGKGDRHRSI